MERKLPRLKARRGAWIWLRVAGVRKITWHRGSIAPVLLSQRSTKAPAPLLSPPKRPTQSVGIKLELFNVASRSER
eukprot:2061226-Alexandrium_andersonii.AAC.1